MSTLEQFRDVENDRLPRRVRCCPGRLRRPGRRRLRAATGPRVRRQLSVAGARAVLPNGWCSAPQRARHRLREQQDGRGERRQELPAARLHARAAADGRAARLSAEHRDRGARAAREGRRPPKGRRRRSLALRADLGGGARVDRPGRRVALGRQVHLLGSEPQPVANGAGALPAGARPAPLRLGHRGRRQVGGGSVQPPRERDPDQPAPRLVAFPRAASRHLRPRAARQGGARLHVLVQAQHRDGVPLARLDAPLPRRGRDRRVQPEEGVLPRVQGPQPLALAAQRRDERPAKRRARVCARRARWGRAWPKGSRAASSRR